MRDAVRVEHGQVILDGAIALRRRMPVRRKRCVDPHDVRVAVDGGYIRSRRVISRRTCFALCHAVCNPD